MIKVTIQDSSTGKVTVLDGNLVVVVLDTDDDLLVCSSDVAEDSGLLAAVATWMVTSLRRVVLN